MEEGLSTGPVQVVDDEDKDSDVQIATPRGKATSSRPSTGMSPEYKKVKVGEDKAEEETSGEEEKETLASGQMQSQGSQRGAPSTAPPPRGEPRQQIEGQPHEAPPGLGTHFEAPKAELTLQDLFNQIGNGFEGVNSRFEKMEHNFGRDLAKVRVEQKETKDIAAKALTTSDQTKKKLQQLTRRVESLEMAPKTPGGGTRAAGASGAGVGVLDLIGGENGTEIVVGKFPLHATRKQRLDCWDIIKRALPQELAEQVEKVDTPGLRGQIIIATIFASPEGPRKNRENLRQFCGQIRDSKLKYQYEGAQYEVYATPTKPYELRMQNAESSLKADALRFLLGEAKGGEMDFELGKGRAYLGNDLLTQRRSFGGPVEYIMENILKHLPETTAEDLAKAEETIKNRRAAGSTLP